MASIGLDLDDDRWSRLQGGYRVAYDPREALRAIENGEDVAKAWKELWNELHHQGDVGEASYAAVPHLVRVHESRGVPDWNTYGLLASIELARDYGRNPDLPAYLQEPYEAAWRRLVEIGLRELKSAEEPVLIQTILGVLAVGKGQRSIGYFVCQFDEDERQEMLVEQYGHTADLDGRPFWRLRHTFGR
jgi:hypothetical protein